MFTSHVATADLPSCENGCVEDDFKCLAGRRILGNNPQYQFTVASPTDSTDSNACIVSIFVVTYVNFSQNNLMAQHPGAFQIAESTKKFRTVTFKAGGHKFPKSKRKTAAILTGHYCTTCRTFAVGDETFYRPCDNKSGHTCRLQLTGSQEFRDAVVLSQPDQSQPEPSSSIGDSAIETLTHDRQFSCTNTMSLPSSIGNMELQCSFQAGSEADLRSHKITCRFRFADRSGLTKIIS